MRKIPTYKTSSYKPSSRQSLPKALAGAVALSLIFFNAGCGTTTGVKETGATQVGSSANNDAAWPRVESPVAKDPAMERRIRELLSELSLEQKVAQMIQADLAHVTADDIREYRIGSVLNGGGQPPNKNADADAAEWTAYAEMLYQAAMTPDDGKVAIPLIWGTDAVHGHGNLKGATLFPHNIGLGASGNVELVEQISAATALEVAASGVDWNFAPTVAVARDIRWGRTYESFSEQPQLVADMGAAAVRGLQGAAQTDEFLDQQRVIATAKHFIGDGGTAFGDDQGHTLGDQEEMIRVHLPGYISAIEAGVQTVMASYSWWQGVHSHGNRYLLTDVLKGHLGFDGLVVSDWQGMAHIPGCRIDSCPEAVNAGVDLFMIPYAPDWKLFYQNTIVQVRSGEIPQSRIDDAVARILRVKMRAGLWHKPSPSQRVMAGKMNVVGSKEHRELARQAVRESLVLLKNNGVLPVDARGDIAVVGDAAKSIAVQSGGWSVTWQTKGVANDMFPGATSIYDGVANAAEVAGGSAQFASSADEVKAADVAIVVFGEEPYAEMYGDIENLQTLEFEQFDKAALRSLKALRARGIPTVALFLSGRPMWVNKELNEADAFVAAWLPGSEGQGVADVLVSNPDGTPRYNFVGRLPYSWPAGACDAVINVDASSNSQPMPLFEVGFGLDYDSKPQPWVGASEDTERWMYGCRLGSSLPKAEDVVFSEADGWSFYAEAKTLERQRLAGEVTVGGLTLAALKDEAAINTHSALGVNAVWRNGSESPTSYGRLVLRNGKVDNDFLASYANDGVVSFDVRLTKQPDAPVKIDVASSHLATNAYDITELFKTLPKGQWQTVTVDLNCFVQERADLNKVDYPFALETDGEFAIDVRNVALRAAMAEQATLACPR